MNIYVTRRIPEEGLKMLEKTFGKIEVNPLDRVLKREELLEKVKGRDGVLCLLTDKIDAEVMDTAGPQCKIFSNYAVGFDNINVPEASKRKIMVTNTPGVLTETTADATIALMFSMARRVVESDKFMRSGQYAGWAPMLLLGKEMTEQTLGIVGAGRIGQNIGEKMINGFRMKVLYSDPNPNPSLNASGAKQVDLETLLKGSDYICINVNYSPKTHHLIGEKELNFMKKDAVIVNTARGPVIDEVALVKALKEKKIFGAGLDVYEDEPVMKPGLKDLDNAILLPHLGSATTETRTKMSTMAAQNLIDALTGKRPEFLVNKEAFE